MVGVAGKSKACKTCKKRKVRCEGEKPTCDRCRKGGRICEGYEPERQFQFKHLSALDHDALLARSQPLTSLTELSYVRVLHGNPAIDEQGHVTNDTVKTKEHSCEHLRRSVSQTSELFLNYLYNYLLKEAREDDNYQTPVSCLQAIGPLRRRNSSLDLAMSALSMVRLGRNCGNEQLHSEGVANYGRVLKDLQNILSSDSRALDEQTLASCMILSLFEATEVSGGNVYWWASHVEGVSRLLQLRGSKLHIDEPSHRLFLGFRPTAIIYALALRKPTYLGETDWLTTPWTTKSKSDFHYMLDIIAQIPILVNQTERVHEVSQSNISVAKRMELLEEAWDLHRQLEVWYQELRKKVFEPLYSERPSSLSWLSPLPPDLGTVFPTLHFQTFEIARLHLLYWTALLLLYDNILKTIYPPLDPNDLSSASSSRYPTILLMTNKPAVRRRALETAKLIARSMEFLLLEENQEMHLRGPLNAFFPLRTAIHIFESVQQYRIESWCRSLFDRLAQRGYPLGQILCGWKWDDIPIFLSRSSLET
ncbi:uncharacterized protein A1O9_12360 [Exophiala aquamarina CBS 119918]|uniref:Zn(2)-C6 fungal-type domain-containing protein n=1 Tax=Exophiala aquamarina CBS 119918 TaxID=1182545 RepID=A0A072P802_9EURO|nr:uncharacterized protein A1O9_12360 [Exophiala aquamarina CBS 119918]KEF51725.1 hypothetical protein A1O9_12360 [Exophiala aquamarina CBS 119918]